jgi:hypothetical protein
MVESLCEGKEFVQPSLVLPSLFLIGRSLLKGGIISRGSIF